MVLNKNSDKTEEAMKTIGEVSELVDVEQHVIRYWESKFPQISPIKYHGRRYYKNEDVLVLKKIKYLLQERGLTIKGVSAALNLAKFDNNQLDINNNLTSLLEKLNKAKKLLQSLD